MVRGADEAHLDAALSLNPAMLEWCASKLDTMHFEGGGEEADTEEADAAAAAATARRIASTPPTDVTFAVRLLLRDERPPPRDDAPPLLDLLERFPDLFKREVLERLDPTDRTMLAQVGRPWLAAVLTSGLPGLPNWVRVWLRLSSFCTSVERLAWAKANGCPWGVPGRGLHSSTSQLNLSRF